MSWPVGAPGAESLKRLSSRYEGDGRPRWRHVVDTIVAIAAPAVVPILWFHVGPPAAVVAGAGVLALVLTS